MPWQLSLMIGQGFHNIAYPQIGKTDLWLVTMDQTVQA